MAGQRVFVVDDDLAILEITKRTLEEDGYSVTTFPAGAEALTKVKEHEPDLVILDVMLPDLDGFEVCRQIRRFSNVPIILLTARSDTVDVVVGLESGADDYVTKPFEVKELTARIRSVLRRIRTHEERKVIRLEDLEIRPEEGIVTKGGDPVSLTKTEFLLLTTLVSAPGRLFSREHLLREVWGYDYFGDGRIVDVHIRRLRSKVENDPSKPELVLTVRGLGYKARDV